jgi:hypothetical protein
LRKSVHYRPQTHQYLLNDKGKTKGQVYSVSRKEDSPPWHTSSGCQNSKLQDRRIIGNPSHSCVTTTPLIIPLPNPFARRCSSDHLTAILRTLAAIRTALASLLTNKATAQRRQTRRQTPAILLLLGRRRLLVLLALRGSVVHLLLGRRRAVLHGRALCVLALGRTVAVARVSIVAQYDCGGSEEGVEAHLCCGYWG